MKIAVVEFAGRGGLAHYAYQLCRGLAERGADVTLVTDRSYELERLPHPFRLSRLLRLWDAKPAGELTAGIATRFGHKLRRAGRAARYYCEWVRLIRFLERERPDIVQLGDLRFAGDLAVIHALRRRGLRLADVCHNVRPFALGGAGSGSFRLSRPEALAFGAMYRRFERVFVHYDVNRDAFLETYSVPAERVVAIPHGNQRIFAELADPASSPARLRAELGIGPDAPVVLYFGTLARYKGVDTLLTAFGQVAAAERKAVLVVAGYPHVDFDVVAHRGLAARTGAGDRVRFVTRYLDSGEVRAWMELASVAVFPHHAVYQSGALMVAQTFGVPIVATAVGATPTIVADGESGLLVPPRDPDALARALGALLGDPARAAALGRRGGDMAASLEWPRIAGRLLVEYDEVLRRSSMPGERSAASAPVSATEDAA